MSDSNEWYQFANKIYVDPFDVSDISVTEIHPLLKKLLNENGLEVFYSLQHNVINYLLNQRSNKLYYRINDICICSPTGSGKTLCYIIPILNYTFENGYSTSIIVTASTILCHQISVLLHKYANTLNVVIKTVPEPVKANHKIYILTPYKLNKLLLKDIITHINFFVFDEADIVFAHGQQLWQERCSKILENQNIKTINDLFNAKKPFTTRMFLSATLTDHPEFISNMNLFKPTVFCINMKSSLENISLHKNLIEIIIECEPDIKSLLLSHLLQQYFIKDRDRVALVFVNSVEMVQKVSEFLQSTKGFKVGILHSGLIGSVKSRSIQKLKNGRINVMVATDALTRGLDVVSIELVINYEKPTTIQTYLHRVGRTCRGFKNGTAITLMANSQVDSFENILNEASRNKNIKKLNISNQNLEELKNIF